MNTEGLKSLLTALSIGFLFSLVAAGVIVFNLPFPSDEADKHLDSFFEASKAIATAFGGIAVLINAYYSAKRAEAMDKSAIAAEKNTEIGLKNAKLTEERLITERFGKAVEQLGHESLQIRLGGIYALERIARDSDRDYWPVMEVLTAFIREDTRSREAQTMGILESFSVYIDVQAALTVLGRRAKSYGKGEEHPLDLTGTDLRGAKLQGANFEGAIFRGTNLKGAELDNANLKGATLLDACLQNVSLSGAKLSAAYMSNADLENAGLLGADFQGAVLIEANFRKVELWGTNLQEIRGNKANFEGALLWETQLQQADLDEANFDQANLREANLEGARLRRATFRGADLRKVKLKGAVFKDVDLTEAVIQDTDYTEVVGLTQEAIDKAIIEEDF